MAPRTLAIGIPARDCSAEPGWATCIDCGAPKQVGLGFSCPACHAKDITRSKAAGAIPAPYQPRNKPVSKVDEDFLEHIARFEVERGTPLERMDPHVRALVQGKRQRIQAAVETERRYGKGARYDWEED